MVPPTEYTRVIHDKKLGAIILRKYFASKAYTLRIRNGKIRLSLPLHGSFHTAEKIIKDNYDQIAHMLSEYSKKNKLSTYNETVLKEKAKAYIPDRIHFLAQQNNFSFSRIRISKSRTRWGSCSSKKSINISCFVMILPPHLIDYVLLHELCHTKEMNYGPSFWSLMDSFTCGKSKKLRKEIRGYSIP